MAKLFGSGVKPTSFEGGIDELERLPLTLRRKLLRADKRSSGSGDPKPGVVENGSERKSISHIDVVVKEEDGHCFSSQGVLSFLSTCSARQGDQPSSKGQNDDCKDPKAVTSVDPCCRISVGSPIDQCFQSATCQKCKDMPGDCNCQGTQVKGHACSEQIICSGVNTDVAGQEKLNVNVCTLHEVTVKNEIPSDFADDDLDHIVLKQRRKMLLSRKLLELAKPVEKGSSGGLSEILMQQCAEKGNDAAFLVDGDLVSGNQLCDNPQRNASVFCRTPVPASSEDIIAESSVTNQCSHELTQSRDGIKIHASNKNRVSERMDVEPKSCEGQDYVPANTSSAHTSTLSTFFKVKVEPKDDNNFHNLDRNAIRSFSFSKLRLKSELEVSDPPDGDELDHIRLRDRMKMPTMLEDSELKIARNIGCLKKSVPSEIRCSLIASESAETIRVNRPRKRRKTATDSVETALEEDAPGLLKVLIDKGVSVDEIKLYGEMECDEALDESFSEESFEELEDLISKLFSQRESFLKFPSARCTKGARANYCLACLFSLVEQTRYLQFRKWPAEWGWCRDLQSFIFVFKRHNRIVLERPEYGYATYFFEIMDSMPIDWQIKRLVTVMKLNSCGRVLLIEDKALVVGEDLSKGEAQVLMEYGWVPNSGLGTMLHYCDRVVHDRKNEKDSSEWRSKIAKLLMDGYNRGIVVATNVMKVEECMGSQNPEVKLEF
ncbi:uncharacterized protein LOC132181328 isoform X2 [Corylus avellana]|uniref:uncharacterized protein LOC132181328 isoform X2 n=1 Tax=Corylus avellana TaxID=13451 RepID=UPI00286CF8E7|nr:uncharacterized protein LOC132181328 isoform X2 [Corylus avellana]